MSPILDEKAGEIAFEIFQGRKIAAIKLNRTTTEVGLKDAKEQIDALEASLRKDHPEKFATNETPLLMRIGRGIIVIAIVCFILVISIHICMSNGMGLVGSIITIILFISIGALVIIGIINQPENSVTLETTNLMMEGIMPTMINAHLYPGDKLNLLKSGLEPSE